MRTFETPRLVLRPFSLDDLDAYYHGMLAESPGEPVSRAACQEDLAVDLSWLNWPLAEFFGRWAVTLKPVQSLIGTLVLMPILCDRERRALFDPGPTTSTLEVEIGWWVFQQYRGHGYAVEAAAALIDYSFGVLHLRRLLAFTSTDNLASIALIRRLGMRVIVHPDTGTTVGILERHP
jgi:RimJ/RimL family protein N-acetyltransferase